MGVYNEIKMSTSQTENIIDEIKGAASLIMQKDSSGKNDTQAVRMLLNVCDVLKNKINHSPDHLEKETQ